MSGGKKYDAGKARLDLIPAEALTELGKVLAMGAEKYGESNWANGLKFSRIIAALLRHANAFNKGEDTDPESGLSHISHVLCNAAFLIWHIQNRPDLDDRWQVRVKETKCQK
jgi:hypothetical protein